MVKTDLGNHENNPQCIICNSSDFEIFLNNCTDLDYGHIIKDNIKIQGFRVIKCSSCGHLYLYPELSPDDIIRYYPKEYGCYQRKTGLSNLLIQLQTKSRFLRLKRYLKAGMRIIDIGYGDGRILEYLAYKNKSYSLYGLEFSSVKADHLLKMGVTLFEGNIESYNFEGTKFDFVFLYSVLEHLFNPRTFLLNIRNSMNSESYINIEVPCINTFSFKLFKEKWGGLHIPRHLHFFSKNRLIQLLHDCGFVVVYTYHPINSAAILASSIFNTFSEKFPYKVNRALLQKNKFFIILLMLSFPVSFIENILANQGGTVNMLVKKIG